jgi:hypothetical protein
MNLESEFLLDVGIEQTSFSKTWQDGTSWLCSFYGQTWKKTHLKNDEKKKFNLISSVLTRPWLNSREWKRDNSTTGDSKLLIIWKKGDHHDKPKRLALKANDFIQMPPLSLSPSSSPIDTFCRKCVFSSYSHRDSPDNLHSTTIMSSRFLVLTLLTRSLTTVSSARFHLLGVVK